MNNFSNTLNDRLAQLEGSRGDLYMADARIKDKVTADLLIGYKNEEPSQQQLLHFVGVCFDNKVIADLGTTKIDRSLKAITLSIDLPVPTKKMSESAEHMRAITANTVANTVDKSLWEVVTKDGVKFLRKVVKERIEDIVAARNAIFAATNLSFARIQAASIMAEKGEIVEWFEGEKKMTGTITSTGKEYTVLGKDGKVYRLAKTAVTHKASPADKKYFEDYLTKAYGKDFGDIYNGILNKNPLPKQ